MWNDVNKILPPDTYPATEVLVYTVDKNYYVATCRIDNYADREPEFRDSHLYKIYEVTHWMDLPKEPGNEI